jgi:hypothetical protein
MNVNVKVRNKRGLQEMPAPYTDFWLLHAGTNESEGWTHKQRKINTGVAGTQPLDG